MVDVKSTNIGGQPGFLVGGRAMFNSGSDLQIGMGYYGGVNTGANRSISSGQYSLELMSICAEYRIQREDQIHFSLPLNAGCGELNKGEAYGASSFVFVEPGLNIVAVPFTDVQLNLGVGVSFRQAIANESKAFSQRDASGTAAMIFVGYGF